jgi:demethylspheroidene O-methyltransferase
MPREPAAPGGLIARLRARRDALLADPAFQRAAGSIPGIRAVARRRACATFDLVAGFVYSQVLQACVQLELFELLARGARPLAQIAADTGLSTDAAARLLDAATALRLTERRGERFRLGPLGLAVHSNRGIRAMVRHHALLYADLADPVALLRGAAQSRRLQAYWPYAAGVEPRSVADEEIAEYTALMSASQTLVADEVLDSGALDGRAALLDVGGGDGTFAAAAAARLPGLRIVILDLPPVALRAERRFRECGLQPRAQAVGGDFFRDPWPTGCDAVSLVRVLHDHDDERARSLIEKAASVLPPRGRLIVAEPLARTAGAEAMGDAYFGFYLLAMGSGRPRSFETLATWMTGAGFVGPRRLRTRFPLQTSVIVAARDRTA